MSRKGWSKVGRRWFSLWLCGPELWDRWQVLPLQDPSRCERGILIWTIHYHSGIRVRVTQKQLSAWSYVNAQLMTSRSHRTISQRFTARDLVFCSATSKGLWTQAIINVPRLLLKDLFRWHSQEASTLGKCRTEIHRLFPILDQFLLLVLSLVTYTTNPEHLFYGWL